MDLNFDVDCRHVGRVVIFDSSKNFHLGARLASRLSFLDGVEVEVSCCFLVIFFAGRGPEMRSLAVELTNCV